MPIPNKIAFEKRYSDDSGVEFGVRYDANHFINEIELEAVQTISMPATQLDWLIESLQAIRAIVRATDGPEGGA